jgi:hypothetical protein
MGKTIAEQNFDARQGVFPLISRGLGSFCAIPQRRKRSGVLPESDPHETLDEMSVFRNFPAEPFV